VKWPRKHKPPCPSPDAKAVTERAQGALDQALEQAERAARVAAESVRVRRRNHFAEAIERSIRREAQ
jgi:hypothetical protein